MSSKSIYCPDCGKTLQSINTGYPQGLVQKMECSGCGAKWETTTNWNIYSDGIAEIKRLK